MGGFRYNLGVAMQVSAGAVCAQAQGRGGAGSGAAAIRVTGTAHSPAWSIENGRRAVSPAGEAGQEAAGREGVIGGTRIAGLTWVWYYQALTGPAECLAKSSIGPS